MSAQVWLLRSPPPGTRSSLKKDEEQIRGEGASLPTRLSSRVAQAWTADPRGPTLLTAYRQRKGSLLFEVTKPSKCQPFPLLNPRNRRSLFV